MGFRFLLLLLSILLGVGKISATAPKAIKLSPALKKTTKVIGKRHPIFISGTISVTAGNSPEDIAKGFIQSLQTDSSSHQSGYSLNSFQTNHPISVKEVTQDALKGNAVVRLSQSVQGIPIFGSDLKVHINAQNDIKVVSGKIFSIEALNTSPSLSKEQAWVKARQYLAPTFQTASQAKLEVYEKEEHPLLTWHFVSEQENPRAEWHVIVSSEEGRLVTVYNNIHSQYAHKNWETFETFQEDVLPGNRHLSNYQTSADPVLNTLHANIATTMDYFYDAFGRNSFDGKGTPVISTAVKNSNYSNAYWDGNLFVFGDGDGSYVGSFGKALDVVAHEYGHAVTDFSANLIYQGESGALNESMSDVWGILLDPEDWLLGEDLALNKSSGYSLRNIQNPEKSGQPDHMSKYQSMSYDNGGVHINSGIPNKAFFHIFEALGKEETEQIYYRALTAYFTQNTDFLGARLGLTEAAKDLFGEDSFQVNSVKKAFGKVGIYIPETMNDFDGTFVESIESTPHPYPVSHTITRTFTQPGATKMKIHFENFSTEAGWDMVHLKNSAGNIVYTYNGNLGTFDSDPVGGDTVTVELVSDDIIPKYGFDITGYSYTTKKIDLDSSHSTSSDFESYFGPNPFNPDKGSGHFQFICPADYQKGYTFFLTLELYSVDGQRLFETKGDVSHKDGVISIPWDGITSQGHVVSNGAYVAYAQLEIQSQSNPSQKETIQKKIKVGVVK